MLTYFLLSVLVIIWTIVTVIVESIGWVVDVVRIGLDVVLDRILRTFTGR